jgi:hypothetical protein
MSTDATPGTPSSPLSAPVTQDEKLWGMLAHLAGFVGYATAFGQYLFPLIIYFVYKDKSKFVAFHALQSLFLQLACLVLGIVLCGAGLAATIPAALIYSIIAAIKTYDGEWFDYYLVGDFARDQLGIPRAPKAGVQ